MKPGWYILNYHNVDWEDSILTRALGVTTRPDVFRHHLTTLGERGRFISIPEGQRMLDSGAPFEEAVFSLWFDDGYSGLTEYAFDICASFDIRPAVSLNARFTLREEMFWRCKLAYLAHADGMRFVRAKLRKKFEAVPFKIRTWTLHHFCDDVLAVVDEVYEACTDATFREDAFRIFATVDDLQRLSDAGWLMSNHTAGHWPLAPGLGWEAVEREFDLCEPFVRRFAPDNPYWVVPFAYGSEHYREQLMARATVVEVAERRNTSDSWKRTGRIFRFDGPKTRDVLQALT